MEQNIYQRLKSCLYLAIAQFFYIRFMKNLICEKNVEFRQIYS